MTDEQIKIDEIPDEELAKRGEDIIKENREFEEGEELKEEINPTFSFENEGDEFRGKYISFKSDVGPNKQMIYTFEDMKGDVYGIWGSQILEGKMQLAKTGEYYCIKYMGKKNSEKSNRAYREWKVISLIPKE